MSQEPNGGGTKATIIDVARRANVSKSLVSLVMHGSPSVSHARRQAVLRAAADLGYRPNALARGMRGRSYTIGVLLSDLHNPFFAEVVDGVEEGLRLTQYRALLGSGGRDPDRELGTIQSMLDRQMDGLILISPSVPEKNILTTAKQAPTVLVGGRMEVPGLDYIVSDDRSGAELAVDHLSNLGHERIAHVSGGEGAGAMDRRRGYEAAMTLRGLQEHIRVSPGSYTDAGGYEGARRLLARNPRPTAIFAPNDLAAVGVLTAVRQAGLTVPGDVSVVGYDNTYLAALSHISLTSVNQPRREMGGLAVDLLLQRIESGRSETRREMLMPALIARSTTAPPPSC
ncbi:MAG TPA: LacI family DNA-binding transcriptional regulator [Rubrobacteraceae bacterium]|nr:LacI family DNA-binding transcriptional regulator [Rubrobacteraceae bacterium]